MENIEQRVLLQAARSSLPTFVELALYEMIPDFQRFEYYDLLAWRIEQEILRTEPGRLAINLPPRHGKSMMMVAIIAWYLGNNPTKEVMVASHSLSLSRDLSGKLDVLIQSHFFKRIFPDFALQPGRESLTDFRTMQKGGFLAGSFDSGLTGRGSDLLIIDDALSANDAESVVRRAAICRSFDTMLGTRANGIRGTIISISHRVHADDISGHLQGLGYPHLALPFSAEEDEAHAYGPMVYRRKIGELLQPDRLSREHLRVPDVVFATQYQQRPTAIGSGILSYRHFPPVETIPAGGKRIVSWDTASSTDPKASYSVAIVFRVMSPQVAYIEHILRERLDYPNLKRRAIDLHNRFDPAQHLVERKHLGPSLAHELRAIGGNVNDNIVPTQAKLERVMAVLHLIEAQSVQLLKGAPYVADFLEECVAFPHGRNDDQVDALTQFLAWQSSNETAGPPKVSILVRPKYKLSRVNQLIGRR